MTDMTDETKVDMDKPMTLHSIARLHELFYVDDEGNLIRKIARSNMKAGDIAGSPNTWGHLKVIVDGSFVYNHRIVWAMTYGQWPDKTIDHINGIKTGFRGVSFDSRRKRFQAQITVEGNHKYLGHFASAPEASAAYEAAAKNLHGDFYRDMGKSNEQR